MFAIKINAEQAYRIENIDTLSLPVKEGVLWLHLEGDMEAMHRWLDTYFSIEASTAKALCDELTRSRLFINSHDELVLTARAFGKHNGEQPMVSIRALLSDDFLLTLSYVEIPAVSTLAQALTDKPKGIQSPHHILERLCRLISDDMTAHIIELDDNMDGLEDDWENLRQLDVDKLHRLRQDMSHFRRHLMPQVEAFSRLATALEERIVHKKEKQTHSARWRELVNAIKRDTEAITELRERITILRDALQQSTNETTNRIMYLLSMVATFFLPLTFLASLLGMNVGGIPIHNKPWAFWAVCGFMLLLFALQWLLFKRWRWLK